jgi:radical SAM protein with 4Fe4S-binding SPASM domain
MMRDWATELGVPFRFDGAIFPCLPDNSTEPLDLRVAPEEVVRREMADPRVREGWAKKLEGSLKHEPTEELYSCAAGGSALYVGPHGDLSPCLMTTHYRFDLKKKPLKAFWNNELKGFREKKRACSDTAATGPLRGLCSHCPAFNYLENGDEEVDSAYGVKLAELRLDFLTENPLQD